MNKRQAKKAFKKKYGMNPNEFERYLEEKVRTIDYEAIGKVLAQYLDECARVVWEVIPAIAQSLRVSIDELVKTIQEHPEIVKEWREKTYADDGIGDCQVVQSRGEQTETDQDSVRTERMQQGADQGDT